MTILVDELQDYQMAHLPSRLRGQWCHLMVDANSPLDDLHAMARRIGLKREWFQDKPRHPHYDLRPSKRALALQCGAQAVASTELVRRCMRSMQKELEL